MIAPIDGPLLIEQNFASLKGGSTEAYTVDHNGVTYHCIGHCGYDISCPVGTPARAVKSGRVAFYGPTWGYPDDGYGPLGLHAVLMMPDGEQFWYAHLSHAQVASGANVHAGDVIALTGDTGDSTGPHLHFAWRPPHPDFASGLDGFGDWITHLDHSVFPLIDLSRV